MNVKPILTPEDYSEYLADKGLYEAYKIRDEVQRTHSIPRLIRMMVDHMKENPDDRQSNP